jgi:ferredoxin
MIVAERKPFEEIRAMLAPHGKVLVAGCGMCVAVCMAGGEKEVEILASQLRLTDEKEGRKAEYLEQTVTRQCDKEYLEEFRKKVEQADAVLSMACGVGVQFLAEFFEGKVVYPAVNTRFLGANEGAGIWTQRCMACASCILDKTGAVCPMTICPKNLLNGPCGGTNHGKCEVDADKDCAWTLIYRRLEKLGRLADFSVIHPPKNFQVMTKPAKYVHRAYAPVTEE